MWPVRHEQNELFFFIFKVKTCLFGLFMSIKCIYIKSSALEHTLRQKKIVKWLISAASQYDLSSLDTQTHPNGMCTHEGSGLYVTQLIVWWAVL